MQDQTLDTRNPVKDWLSTTSLLYPLRETVKRVVFKTGLAKTRWPYNITPGMVLTLLDGLRRTERVAGDVIEIGVARGKTTLLLNAYMTEIASARRYIALDTFFGFTDQDIEYENTHRGKGSHSLSGFAYNDPDVWKKIVVDANQLERVSIVQADINAYEFPEPQRFSLAFIDVDLYRPSYAAMNKVWERLSPGGWMILDDIARHPLFDGALQAFEQFVSERGITSWESAGCKGAVIKKA